MKDKISLSHIRFAEAFDFPGEQRMHVTCIAEPAEVGVSFVGAYVPALASFEVRVYNSGKLASTMMVPRERVKQYTVSG